MTEQQPGLDCGRCGVTDIPFVSGSLLGVWEFKVKFCERILIEILPYLIYLSQES